MRSPNLTILLRSLAIAGAVLLGPAGCSHPPAGWPRVIGGLAGRTELPPAPEPPAVAPPPPRLVLPPADPRYSAERFRNAQLLRDRALITPDDFARRRTANLAALLPLTGGAPPAAGLDQPGPGAATVVARLDAIARALSIGALSADAHAAERAAILEALLPAGPVTRTAVLPLPPATAVEAAAAEQRLDDLRRAGLITAAEQHREERAIARTLAAATPNRPEPVARPTEPAAPASAPSAVAPLATPPPAAPLPPRPVPHTEPLILKPATAPARTTPG